MTARPASWWERLRHMLGVARRDWRTPLLTVDDDAWHQLQAVVEREEALREEVLRAQANAAVFEAEVRTRVRLSADEVAPDLPRGADGLLHHEAFAALIEAQVWAAREHQLTELTATTHDDTTRETR